MKNTLKDLNNHLFAELERLGDEDLEGDKLEGEIKRAKAISDVSSTIIELGALAIRAENTLFETGRQPLSLITGGAK